VPTPTQGYNPENYTDDKATVLLKLWRNSETGRSGGRVQKDVILRPSWIWGIKLYPGELAELGLVQGNNHGQA
jgi:hypothetical protein